MATQNKIIQRFLDDLRRDKKKTVILAVLAVVGAVVVIQALVAGKTPAAARAEALLADDPSRDALRGDAAAPAPEPAGQDAKRQKYLQQIDRRITRDIFAMNAEAFPCVDVVVVPRPTPPPATSSAPSASDAEVVRRLVEAQARRLGLQSTVSGPSAFAIINDRVLKIGDRIDDFEIVDIATDSCTVRKNDVNVTLELTRNK